MKTHIIPLLIIGLTSGLIAKSSQSTFTLESVSHPNHYVIEDESLVGVSTKGDPLEFRIVKGLSDPKYVSIESVERKGYYLRHHNDRIKLHEEPKRNKEDSEFSRDATFEFIKNKDGSVTFRSINYFWQYISVTYSDALYTTPDSAPEDRHFWVKRPANKAE